MDNVFRVKIKGKGRWRVKNRFKRIIANMLNFIVLALIYDEEKYQKLMNKVDMLREDINE